MHVVARISLAIGITACAIVGAVTVPFIRLPAPTGTSAVGTRDVVIAGGMPVRFWYPASRTGAKHAVYRTDAVKPTLRERVIFSLVRTAAFDDAPIATGPHALVLYIPGWGGQRAENTALCEDLASHGFVVAAIDDQEPQRDMDFSNERATRDTVQWADTKVQFQSRAVSNVLTSLQRVVPADPIYALTSTLDFTRVAAVGFSFGGATAADAAIADSRIRSAVNLDGWIFGRTARGAMDKPFMMLSTGAATVDPPANGVPKAIDLGRYEAEFDRRNGQAILAGFQRNGGYFISVDGTQHESFSDTGVLPLRLRPIPGSIDGTRAQRIVVAYVNAFLALTLDGRAAPLLTRASGERGSTSRSELDRAAQVTIWTAPTARRTSG